MDHYEVSAFCASQQSESGHELMASLYLFAGSFLTSHVQSIFLLGSQSNQTQAVLQG